MIEKNASGKLDLQKLWSREVYGLRISPKPLGVNKMDIIEKKKKQTIFHI